MLSKLLKFLLPNPDRSTRLKTLLSDDDAELISALIHDIQDHVHALQDDNESFYGYAVMPGDYRTQPEPATVQVAIGRESDLKPEHATDPYYRYCVSEWKTWIRDGFERTKHILRSRLEQFKELHQKAENDFALDQYEETFIQKTDDAILQALKQLQQSGVFSNATYLIIWYPGNSYPIMRRSAQQLNSPEVSGEVAKLL